MNSNAGHQKISYNICKFSSYSGIYTPDKILENCQSDQTSRWSSESNNPPQYLILKLEKPAILKQIVFGKFEKPHVCNLKRFTIYGSLNESGYIELFSGGLKNDSRAETFPLKHSINGQNFPCSYIKIVPIQSWAVSFNFSIWYVELIGDCDADTVAQSVSWFKKHKERQAMRLCLKHLRQTNHLDVYDLLQSQCSVLLEHPLITTLHQALVLNGDFETSEEIVFQAVENGNNAETSPGMRGGHQMIIDVTTETIYLFGGWDGCQDLSDFWSYNIGTRRWTCLSKQTELDGGPTPRSCHKMLLDSLNRRIFCLGRYVEASQRTEDNLKNDFYVYCIRTNTWYMISDDTYQYGGPKLIFDHHMVIDQEREVIYCFGGRILSYVPPTTEDRKLLEQQFSGLYAYHIPTDSWALVREDTNDVTPSHGFIRSRIGHSMLFHEKTRRLYIFAGQRSKDYLTDMFVYYVDRDEIEMISDGTQTFTEVPVAGFTQRATIDTDLDEIYVFSGLNKDKEKKDDCVQNSFWVYSLTSNNWSCVYQNENDNDKNEVPSKLQYAVGMRHKQVQEPCPRYAHQLVYDSIRKVHYMFGGNPGRNALLKIRLDDFWMLKLHRPAKFDLERKCKFMLRKCKYLEMLTDNPLQALTYLQNSVSQTVSNAEEETADFHRLANVLFESADDKGENNQQEERFEKRNEVFNELCSYFAEDMMPPKENLIDLIPI